MSDHSLIATARAFYERRIAKIAFGGLLLGSIWGSHVALAVVFSTSEGSFALFQWCAYAISLTTFHIMEFLVTALFNPDSATYDCK